jgi:hypothetical protein
VIGNAVMVMKIATGEVKETPAKQSAAAELGQLGGRARAKRLTAKKRQMIAKKAAETRWKGRE